MQLAGMKRLLVIDDEPTILLALGEFFSEKGWTAEISTTIERAEHVLKTQSFDAVVADLRLTGVEGTEGLAIISYVRELQDAGTVVVLLTAFGSDEVAQEAELRGADAMIRKPIPLPDLERQLNTLLEKRRGGEG